MGSVTDPREVTMDGVRSGFLPDRIVHLHPTRLCNLACLHCYSESDQRRTGALDPSMLIDALALLREEGYTAISLSGGEPLVYRPVRELITQARSLGFRVTMVSNGLLAATDRMDDVLSQLDGLAISFDGLAETHNAIRGRADAFQRASTALERLAALGRPVGAAISLTRRAIPELPDLADHLASLGARALQIRPVARAGRARTMNTDAFYTTEDTYRLYLVVLALQQELPVGVRVHCDLAPAQGLWHERDAYAGLLATCDVRPLGQRPLADLINPLVINENGVLKPLAYDFDERFNITSAFGLSRDRLQQYKAQHLPRFQALIGETLAGLADRRDLVDWFDHCTRCSERFEREEQLQEVR